MAEATVSDCEYCGGTGFGGTYPTRAEIAAGYLSCRGCARLDLPEPSETGIGPCEEKQNPQPRKNYMSDVVDRHRKQLAVMRGFLEGREFYLAAAALELVRSVSDETRKDGITPGFHHQLSVTRLVTTLLPHLTFPEETLAAAFLHDLLEDHGDVWTREKLEAKFGKRVADAVWCLSKKSNGMTKSYESYYGALAMCPIGSIVKLADRAHNIQTMHGVFTLEKQRIYIREVEQWYYPMIRQARREFPRQYGAYENLKILLRCQCRLVEHVLEASGVQDPAKPV